MDVLNSVMEVLMAPDLRITVFVNVSCKGVTMVPGKFRQEVLRLIIIIIIIIIMRLRSSKMASVVEDRMEVFWEEAGGKWQQRLPIRKL
jgi:hypothetical protein